tara:strand:- start:1597 stop:2424 length:828 start_codon:yes stop_codon:yes gene_type:complete
MKNSNLKICLLCKGSFMQTKKNIFSRPSKETDFLMHNTKYRRKIRRCKTCGIFLNQYDYDLDLLYKKVYNERTYGNNLSKHFDHIMSLPYSKSDNKQRVERINNYFIKKSKSLKHMSVLDIGSGLCVFLAELKKYCKSATCIDPSAQAINHAKNYVGIKNSIQGNFDDLVLNNKYDLITLNKVLEHLKNPIDVMLKAKSLLNPNGYIYVEVPDGDSASKNGGFINREEFYIEHYTIFNKVSFNYLATKSRLNIDKVESIHEPSDKYTIYGFLSIK